MPESLVGRCMGSAQGYLYFSQCLWDKEVIHLSHLDLAMNVMLWCVSSKKKRPPCWDLSHSNHEGILDTLRHRDLMMYFILASSIFSSLSNTVILMHVIAHAM